MTFLITGATGNVGSLIVDSLLATGTRTRVFIRDREKAVKRFGDHVEIFTGDLANVDTMISALEGADVMFLVNSGPSLAAHDQQAAEMAKRCGISRIVKLSSYDSRKNIGTGKWHACGEAAIRASGLPFTFLQPSGFMSNALLWAKTIKVDGVIRSATGDGKIPFIHPRDIAAVSAKALLSDHYSGVSIPITGPEALSFAEMGTIIGKAIGKPVNIEPIGEEGVRQEQLAVGMSEAEVEAHLSIYRGIREGALSEVTDGVESVLGRKAITFEQWVDENVQTFK